MARPPSLPAPPAARGKKMTRSVSRGISSKARTISAWRRPVSVVVGTAAHMPVVELAAEHLDQALLVLGDLEVAFGDQLLAVARPHAQELHRRRLCQRRCRPTRLRRADSGAVPEAEHVDRAGARAELAKAVAYGF